MTDHSMTFIDKMLVESEAYSDMVNIEKIVEQGLDLRNIPIQPLYLALKALPSSQVGPYLEKLSSQQRTIFLDLDLWKKDDLDPTQFYFWVDSYYHTQNDEIKKEFVLSNEFGLFLKARFNIWTFDVEDPEYPDHDYYFLSEDSLLLFEYDETFGFVNEAKQLTRDLYSYMGVEGAYRHILRFISEDYLPILEEEYQQKNSRLVDAGFVDYYDSLNLITPHISFDIMVNKLLKLSPITPDLHESSKNQILPKSSLVPFNEDIDPVKNELRKISDPRRQSFLQFNFIRLMNGYMSYNESLRDGSIAISRNTKVIRALIKLGIDFYHEFLVKEKKLDLQNKSVFEFIDFCEIFRLGHSLVFWEQKKIKNSMKINNLQTQSTFIGEYIDTLIDGLFDSPSKILTLGKKQKVLESYSEYADLSKMIDNLISLFPFISQINRNFLILKENGSLNDDFYLNYNVDDIDFEAIVLSSFANIYLDIIQSNNQPKLGLTIDEYKAFTLSLTNKSNSFEEYSFLDKSISLFITHYGLENTQGLREYVVQLIERHLTGYDFEKLENSEYKHIGGPIILAY